MNVATPPKPASAESAAPRLTELARFAGCAAKISQAALHKALGVQQSRQPARDAEAASQAWKPWRSYAVVRAWNAL